MENEIASMGATAAQVAIHYEKERMQQMLLMAQKLVAAGCFGQDVQNAEQAFVKMQSGYEIGMPPVEAMNSFYIVNGKITIYGSAMTKRLRLHGWKIDSDEQEGSCKITITHIKTGETYNYTATRAELEKLNSKAAKFAGKDKLFWHAISRLIRRYVPEVMGAGVGYLAEEAEFFHDPKASVSVADNSEDTYQVLRCELEAAVSTAKIEEVKQQLIMIGSTLSDFEQKEIKEMLLAKLKTLQHPTAQEKPVTNIVEPTSSPDAAIEPVVMPETPAATEEVKKWKQPKAKLWTPDKIKSTIDRLDQSSELRGFKDELNMLFNDGEITASVRDEAIAMIQEKINKHWESKSVEQAEKVQTQIE